MRSKSSVANKLKKSFVVCALGLSLLSPRLAASEGTVTTTTAYEWHTDLERQLWETAVRFRTRAHLAEEKLSAAEAKLSVRTATDAASLIAPPIECVDVPDLPWLEIVLGVAAGFGVGVAIGVATK